MWRGQNYQILKIRSLDFSSFTLLFQMITQLSIIKFRDLLVGICRINVGRFGANAEEYNFRKLEPCLIVNSSSSLIQNYEVFV